MRVSRTYGGNYYKAEDFDKPALLTIEEATSKEFDDGKTKIILAFRESDQTFVVNNTNAQVIAELYGDESDDWQGQRIVLFRDKTTFAGKLVPCIRVRAPRPAANNGHAQTPAPAPAPVRQHAPVLTQAEADDVQTDDDIPF